MRHLLLLIATVTLVLLGGCKSGSLSGSGANRSLPPPPAYRDIVEAHNRSVAPFSRLWSRAIVEVRYKDPRGRRRFEQGDGNLILVQPNQLALSIGKLGNIFLWIGSDDEQYWLIDAMEEPLAYIGRHDASESSRGVLGALPVRPADMPALLGIVPIALPDEPDPRESTAVEWYEGKLLVEPPGGRVRLLMDPATFRPTRIDVLDAAGRSVASSLPEHWEFVDQSVTPLTGLPQMATRFALTIPGSDSRMVLFLSDMTDGVEDEKINPRVFEFDRVRKMLKVPPESVTDLDSPPPVDR